MTIKDDTTGEGGNRAYSMVRSKFVKGKDGYGRVISLAREKMLASLKARGIDPSKVSKDTVAGHMTKSGGHADGAQHSKDPDDHIVKPVSRAENSRASATHMAMRLKRKRKK